MFKANIANNKLFRKFFGLQYLYEQYVKKYLISINSIQATYSLSCELGGVIYTHLFAFCIYFCMF